MKSNVRDEQAMAIGNPTISGNVLRKRATSVLFLCGLMITIFGQAVFGQAGIDFTPTAKPGFDSFPADDRAAACTVDPVVLNNADSGTGSLRQAVIDACPSSHITFIGSVVSPIVLTGGQITLAQDVSIDGPGARLMVIQNGRPVNANNGRVFVVNGGTTVTMSGITITGGHLFANGAGISSGGNLTLDRVEIRGNQSGDLVQGRSAAGAGIEQYAGALVIRNSTIADNIAGGVGAGVLVNFNASLEMYNTTVTGNESMFSGGGVRVYASATAKIVSCTITNNRTHYDFDYNSAPNGSGLSVSSTASAIIANTIVADNYQNIVDRDVQGPFTSQGYNFIGNVGAATGFTGLDQVGNSTSLKLAQLQPLAYNGGQTRTHEPLLVSQIIDKGKAFSLATDQRGGVRTYDVPATVPAAGGDNTDIGAFELQTPTTTTRISSSVNPSVTGQSVTLTATVEANAADSTPAGTVSFADGPNDIPGCQNRPLSASGQAACTTSFRKGSHSITAFYTGSQNPSFGSLAQTVNSADTTAAITSDAPDPSVLGQNYTVTVSVSVVAPGSGTPTGRIFVSDSDSNECVITLPATTCILPSSTVGQKNLFAFYEGDINFLGGAANGATHTVNQISTATTVTSSRPTSTYGESVTFTATATAVAPGTGTPSGVYSFYDGLNAIPTCQNVPLNGSGSAQCTLATLGAGVHNVAATYLGSPAYIYSAGSVQQTVNKAILTITVDDKTRTYGAPDPPFTYTTTGYVLGQNAQTSGVTGAPVLTTTADQSSPVMVYPINIGPGTLASANYDFDLRLGHLTITKAPLTVTANNATRVYGSANPAFTASYSGFVLGQTLATSGVTGTPAITTTATPASPVNGSPYPITPSTGTLAAQNYSFTFANGALTITKANLTVTADNATRQYGSPNQTFTATYTGFVLGQTLATSDVTGSPSLTTNAVPSSQVNGSPYTITATIGTLQSGNYNFTMVNGQLTITKAPLTVTANSFSRVFGSPNPTLTATFAGYVNGEVFATSGILGSPSISTTATQSSGVGSYPITITAGTLSAPNYSFTFVNGTLTITQAATTTVITNANALSNQNTTVGQAYAVSWAVSPVAPSTGTPTGTVTVSDGTNQCQAAVAAGSCTLTSTTPGFKTITAVYSGDANFTGSNASSVAHTVGIAITGNIRQYVPFGTNSNLAGVTVRLSGSATEETTTDANGNYAFTLLSAGGNFVISPSGLGKTYEAISRTLTNVSTNVPNADFVAYNAPGPGGNPREIRVGNMIATPGQPIVVPVVVTAQGNETKFAFSLSFDPALLGVPTAVCGSDAAGCTIAVNNSLAGKVGVTVTPAAAIAAGVKEIVRITFPTVATGVTNTPLTFGDTPTLRDVRNGNNDPIPALYKSGFVGFSQNSLGFEGDVVNAAGASTGGDGVQSNDVTVIRQMVLGLVTPDPTNDQFQRADAAPTATLGDGRLDSADVTVIRLYNLGVIPPTNAAGPISPVNTRPEAEPAAESRGAGRTIRAGSVSAEQGRQVIVPIEIDSHSDESAVSFTVNFDPSVLSNPVVKLGSEAAAGSTLTTNAKEAELGSVAILVDSTSTYAAGTRQIVTIRFDVRPDAANGDSQVTFSDSLAARSVSSSEGVLIAANYENGIVRVGKMEAGVSIAGNVLAPDGRGLRNVTVSLSDASGVIATATTGSHGAYRFDGIAAEHDYVIEVTSKRFRYTKRSVKSSNNLGSLDLVGQE